MQASTIGSVSHARKMAGHLFKDENEVIIVRQTIDSETDREGVENALVDMQLITRQTKGNTGIFTVAISPREGEKLTEEQQARAIEIIEQKFGLEGQVRLQVDHVKEGRAHSHIFWSMVDQEKGKLINLSHYKYGLQDCAVQMTDEFGHKHIPRRANENSIEVTNADRMRQQKGRKCVARKQEISRLWNETKTAEEFLKRVRVAGYEVAKGERSRFVLIDQDGKAYNLVRELPKLVKAKEVRSRFGEAEKELLSVEQAKKQMEERQMYDREQAEINRQNKELDSADEAARKKVDEDRGLKEKKQKRTSEIPLQARRDMSGGRKSKVPDRKIPANDHLERLDAEREWFTRVQRHRMEHEKKMAGFYKRDSHLEKLAELERQIERNSKGWGKVSGKLQKLQDELEAHKLSLNDIDQKIAWQTAKLEKEITKSKPPEISPPSSKKENNPVVDFEAEKEKTKEKEAEKQRKIEAFKDRMRQADQEQGLDIDY